MKIKTSFLKSVWAWFPIALPLLALAAVTVVPGRKISEYPNRGTPQNSDYFILELQSPVTNNNLTYAQLKAAVTNGLATTNMLTNAVFVGPGGTNVGVTTNFSGGQVTFTVYATNDGGVSASAVTNIVTNAVFVAAGGTNVGIVTNYTTGKVTYTVYATNDGGGSAVSPTATNGITGVWTNDVNVSTPTTNLNFWFLSTAGVFVTNRTGLVDVRLATLSAVDTTNLINTIINFLPLRTNQFTTNIDNVPVYGQLWLSGTQGFINTTGAVQRVPIAFEYNPIFRSLRWGAIAAEGGNKHPVISSSNFWTSTNLGPYSVAFGSNNLVVAALSTVAGGVDNLIFTNAYSSYIGGGTNNEIRTNAFWSTIGGGQGNRVHVDAIAGTVGGGSANIIYGGATYATIAGGQANETINTGSTIGGGRVNVIVQNASSTYSTIGGGQANIVQAGYGTVSGGNNNRVFSSVSTASTIAGGDGNRIGSSAVAGTPYNVVSGGLNNLIDGNNANGGYSFIAGGDGNILGAGGTYGVIGGGRVNLGAINSAATLIPGGVSNSVQAAYGATLGWFLTNLVTKTIDLGYADANKVTVNTNGINFNGVTNLVAGTITNLHRYVGRVRLVSGSSQYFITNNLVTVNSIVMATLNSDCGTILSNAVPTAGLLTITTLAATSANADISFQILTP